MNPLPRLLAAFAMLAALPTASARETSPNTSYELRVDHAADGKLDALHQRYRDHALGLFAKHGITPVGFWVPLDNPDRKLIYLLSYPDAEARDAAWKAFEADENWLAAKAASDAGGALVERTESRFLTPTDFSTVTLSAEGAPHTFELRTYTATSGHLPNLLSRFRDHTLALFNRHGMQHFHYFTPAKGQPGENDTLIYFLAHPSTEASKTSFDAFRADPEWIKARDASEAAAGGSLTIPDGVKSELLAPTGYSPAK